MEGAKQEKEHDNVFGKFHMIDRVLKRIIEKKAVSTGVYRSQHHLLMHIFFHENCSQIELAEKSEISPAAVAVSIKKLEKGGYIKRICKENDNRTNQIIITQKGNEVVKESIRMFRDIEETMFEGFSEEEIQQLNYYFDKMHHNLEVCFEGLKSQ